MTTFTWIRSAIEKMELFSKRKQISLKIENFLKSQKFIFLYFFPLKWDVDKLRHNAYDSVVKLKICIWTS